MKIIALATALTSTLFCTAQPTLNYTTHGLLAGHDNPMSICEYTDPGMAGENVQWNFADLQFTKSFIGYLNNSAQNYGNRLDGANTVLTEFNSQFFFDVTETGIEQYGYSSSDGKMVTEYDVPFIKIKYPFAYGDNYTGTISAATIYQGNPQSVLSGDYTVTADAYGTLTLPGNVVYENTLRVKTQRIYTSTTGSNESDIELTTYRWYNNSHRFPLLVLTEYKVTSGEKVNTTFQSAYNNNAVQNLSPAQEESFALYPNPVATQLSLKFAAVASGTIRCTIVDASGRLVNNFHIDVTEGGSQSVSLDKYVAGLRPSSYVLRIENGKQVSEHSFIVLGN